MGNLVNEGWVKLWRELLSKSIWTCSSPEHTKVLITILLLANHERNEWEWKGEKYTCEPGQLITSLQSIVTACGAGVSMRNVRTALQRFEKLGFLTNETTKTGRLITIVNWGKYQGEVPKGDKASDKQVTKHRQRGDKQVTKHRQRGDKEVTTNKNDKNDKNERINPLNPPYGGTGGRVEQEPLEEGDEYDLEGWSMQ